MITRKQYFLLTRLDSDGLTALRRRDQVPFPSEARGEYSLWDAFTVNIANHFANAPDGLGMNRTVAAQIVRDMGRLLIDCREAIENASHFNSKATVLAGRLYRQQIPFQPFCGGNDDLAADLAMEPRVVHLALMNVGLAFASLRVRCERNDIEMVDVWPDPQSIPSFEERDEAAKSFLPDLMRDRGG